MCGRYHLIATGQQIMEHFSLPSLPVHHPDYNIPPGQKILAIVQLEDGSNRVVNLHWGFIPAWSKDRTLSTHLINARAETLAEKPSFKQAYRQRRCLIPATGFFEWHSSEAGKKPYHIHRSDHALFAFAGLWEHWEHDQEAVYSCAMVTTTASADIAPIHDRMPVIIVADNYNRWLAKNTAVEIADFLADDVYRALQISPISTYVNNPLHNDSRCLK